MIHVAFVKPKTTINKVATPKLNDMFNLLFKLIFSDFCSIMEDKRQSINDLLKHRHKYVILALNASGDGKVAAGVVLYPPTQTAFGLIG